MVQMPTHHPPTDPGEMLLEEFLNLMLVQRDLADAIYVPCQRINDIALDHRNVTPSTAPPLAGSDGINCPQWFSPSSGRQQEFVYTGLSFTEFVIRKPSSTSSPIAPLMIAASVSTNSITRCPSTQPLK